MPTFTYLGTWNALTNVPHLTSGSGPTTAYSYYKVSVGGSTTIDGVSSWGAGTWIVWSGSAWENWIGLGDAGVVSDTATGDGGLVSGIRPSGNAKPAVGTGAGGAVFGATASGAAPAVASAAGSGGVVQAGGISGVAIPALATLSGGVRATGHVGGASTIAKPVSVGALGFPAFIVGAPIVLPLIGGALGMGLAMSGAAPGVASIGAGGAAMGLAMSGAAPAVLAVASGGVWQSGAMTGAAPIVLGLLTAGAVGLPSGLTGAVTSGAPVPAGGLAEGFRVSGAGGVSALLAYGMLDGPGWIGGVGAPSALATAGALSIYDGVFILGAALVDQPTAAGGFGGGILGGDAPQPSLVTAAALTLASEVLGDTLIVPIVTGQLIQDAAFGGNLIAPAPVLFGEFGAIQGAIPASSGTGLKGLYSIGPTLVGKIVPKLFGMAPFRLYRPANGGPALARANFRYNIPAWITGDPQLMATKPIGDTSEFAYVGLDPTLVVLGDYLVGQIAPTGPIMTFFVFTLAPPAPIQLVLCNSIVDVRAQPVASAFGAVPGYGGDLQGAELPILTQWPASLRSAGTKSKASVLRLPGDGEMGWVMARLPVLPAGVRLSATNRLYDNLGNRYTVSNVDQGVGGWQIAAQLALA